jgi:hypothetical protein
MARHRAVRERLADGADAHRYAHGGRTVDAEELGARVAEDVEEARPSVFFSMSRSMLTADAEGPRRSEGTDGRVSPETFPTLPSYSI